MDDVRVCIDFSLAAVAMCGYNELYLLLHSMQSSHGLADISKELPTRGSFLGPGGNDNLGRNADALRNQMRQSTAVASVAQSKKSATSISGSMREDSKADFRG